MYTCQYDVHELLEESLREDELFEIESKVGNCLDDCKAKILLSIGVTLRIDKLLANLIEEFDSLILESLSYYLLVYFFAPS